MLQRKWPCMTALQNGARMACTTTMGIAPDSWVRFNENFPLVFFCGVASYIGSDLGLYPSIIAMLLLCTRLTHVTVVLILHKIFNVLSCLRRFGNNL